MTDDDVQPLPEGTLMWNGHQLTIDGEPLTPGSYHLGDTGGVIEVAATDPDLHDDHLL